MRLPEPITSRTNAKVKALRAAFRGKASRPGDLVGIEGFKSVLEAFKAGLHFDTLAVSTEGSAAYSPEHVALLNTHDFIVVAEDVMSSIADTVTPPLIAATVAIPASTQKGPPSRTFLLLDTIQDPGNLGTLIRSAEAFGVERVYLSPGCANPWSPKVLRASAGSVFRQSVVREDLLKAITELKGEGVRILGAVARSEGASVSLVSNLSAPIGILIGNEGAGLSEELLGAVDEKVYIPCLTESLNAAIAGSVLLYDALSQNVHRAATNPEATPVRERLQ